MRAIYYTKLRDLIMRKNPSFLQVKLWNNQYLQSENNHPLVPPFCFIDFGDLVWESIGDGLQECEANIQLHIGVEFVLESDSLGNELASALQYDGNVLELFENFDLSINGVELWDGDNQLSSELVNVSASQVPASDALHIWIFTYRARLFKDTTWRDADKNTIQLPGFKVTKL
jgi:hypothetical protein